MKKLKIYLDTSVISYLLQPDAPEKMEETRRFWEILKEGRIYEVYISDIVLNEISRCSKEKLDILLAFLNQIEYNIIGTDEKMLELADKFIDFGIFKQKCIEDCQHIAAALLEECDIITFWNFKHIVNVKTIKGVKVITTMEGYKDLLIYPPSVLLEDENDDDEGTNHK